VVWNHVLFGHIIDSMKKIIFIFLVVQFNFCFGQDMNAFVLTDDANYFNFWEGTWYVTKEDNSVDTAAYFKIKRSVNPASFIEEWKFSGMKSAAIRAWDKTNSKWGFVWISENGLYQVWDSKKIDGNWFIYKTFTVNGDTYLSRQGFIPQPDGTVLRISEKSYDEKKWELRFKQILRKR
jgi:hypothetical protein